MKYTVLDFEFNQAFNFKSGASAAPNPDCPFEIIQIGAVNLSEELQSLDKLNIYIKPQIYKKVHPYVKKITGITDGMLKKGISFKEAYDVFLDFTGGGETILCSWGSDDITSLFKNILFYGLDFDAVSNKYIDAQKLANNALKTEKGKSIGLKNAVEEFDIKIEENFHNALNDAVYTAEIFKLVCPKDVTPDYYNIWNLVKAKKEKPKIDKAALSAYMEKKFKRKLTAEEYTIAKMAYNLGYFHKFDIKQD